MSTTNGGTTWSGETGASPGFAEGASFEGVSCASTSECMAVGGTNGIGEQRGIAEGILVSFLPAAQARVAGFIAEVVGHWDAPTITEKLELRIGADLTIHVIEGLSINWNDPPKVQGNAIQGSAAVTNQTPNELDVTVVIVAVNEIGRATALGYQHFTLPANATSPVIQFGSSPGNGTYYVRADAVAHRPGKHSIYRVNKQADGIKLTQF